MRALALLLAACLVAGPLAARPEAPPQATVQAAVWNVPQTLTINAERWTVDWADEVWVEGQLAAASADCGRNQILLDRQLDGPATQRFLLHEVMHALVGCVDGISTTHRFIYVYSERLPRVLQENPRLARYLQQQVFPREDF